MTAIPAALNGLLAAFKAAPGLSKVTIIDGPWLAHPEDPDVLVVGWTPSGDMSIEYVDAIAGLGSTRETFDVPGLVSAWRGGATLEATRARADELIEVARSTLQLDPTLGGAVTRARLATLVFDQYRTDQGTQVSIEFVVRVDAFR